jgi:hypothetical protein
LNEEGYLIIGELVCINSPSLYFLEFLEMSPADYLTVDQWRLLFSIVNVDLIFESQASIEGYECQML